MFYRIEPTEKIALLSSEGERLTYAELLGLIMEIGQYMRPRRLVFCLCENRPASVVGYLSSLNRGVVPLLLDKKIDRLLLKRLLEIYLPDYLYVPTSMVAEFVNYKEVFRCMQYVLLMSKAPAEIELHEELALLLTTSGSTGSPKLVRQSYQNIQSNAEAIAEYLNLTENERPITTLPMSYTYGLSIINSHLQVGATILMTDQPMNMKLFWSFMKEQRATSFGGVPFTYEMLKKVHFFDWELPNLRYMTQAGGKLSPELHREFAEWCVRHGKQFIVMYGQTEATARMGYLPADKSIEKYGSMGKAIPGGKFVLIDVDGKEIVTSDTVGELVYEGANVTLGYAEKKDDLAKGDERNGRLITGDMAKRDSDGYYYVVGRKKRFLKIYGNRVNLDEVDQMIKKKFTTLDCASTGTDDHMKIFVTSENAIDEVRRWLVSTTHLNEIAIEVLFIDEIPKNEAGKVLYSALLEYCNKN